MSGLLTTGRLARLCGLSRSALLHYEAERLLVPRTRSAAGYRLYGADEVERLQRIRAWREAGLGIAAVRDLLAGGRSTAERLLQARLVEINRQVAALREQQQAVARLLGPRGLGRQSRRLDKARWVAVLRRAGFDDAAMRRWHAAFEAEAPQAHQDFLDALGIAPAAAAQIRAAARRAVAGKA